MTDTQKQDAEPNPIGSTEDDPDGLSQQDFTAPDHILALLIRGLTGLHDDNTLDGATITVAFDGLLVSGSLISKSDYTSRLRSRIKDPASAEFITDFFDMFDEERREMFDRRVKAGLPIPMRRYIHMANVSIYTGTQVIDSPLWRGELAKVSGWSFGSTQDE